MFGGRLLEWHLQLLRLSHDDVRTANRVGTTGQPQTTTIFRSSAGLAAGSTALKTASLPHSVLNGTAIHLHTMQVASMGLHTSVGGNLQHSSGAAYYAYALCCYSEHMLLPD